jgi:2-keto-4-pentenoate hydratase
MLHYPCKLKYPVLALLLSVASLTSAETAQPEAPELASIVRQTLAEGGVAPLLSARVPGFDLDRAFAVQAELVKAWPASDPIAGFKSAMNSKAAQQQFGLPEAVFAVLPTSGRICAGSRSPCAVTLGNYRQPVFEVEVALRIAAPIDRAPASEAAVLDVIDAVMLAVELPELAMAPGAARGEDYVASNVGVRAFIVGEPHPIELLSGALPIQLSNGGRVIAQGDGGGALAAARELIVRVVARGYTLQPGHILLTGPVGGMQPGKSGAIVADGGALGSIRFIAR